MLLKLTDSQQAVIGLKVTHRGKPADVEAGSIAFTSSDPSVVTVTQDPNDPKKAIAKSVSVGTAQITAEGDADLGDGVTKLTKTIDVVVVTGQADALDFEVGTPEEQPE